MSTFRQSKQLTDRLHLCVHLVIDDKVVARSPVANFHSLACCYDVLSHALRWPDQRLTLTDSQDVMKVLTNHAPAGVKLMSYAAQTPVYTARPWTA